MSLSTAITRLQAIALACTTVTIKAAPDIIQESALMLPMSLCYPATGTGQADNATQVLLLPVVNVDVHFSRISLTKAYDQIQKLIPEYLQRLGGDPTLAGAVDTIVFPVTFQVFPFDWNQVVTECVRFSVPLKLLTTPTTTA